VHLPDLKIPQEGIGPSLGGDKEGFFQKGLNADGLPQPCRSRQEVPRIEDPEDIVDAAGPVNGDPRIPLLDDLPFHLINAHHHGQAEHVDPGGHDRRDFRVTQLENPVDQVSLGLLDHPFLMARFDETPEGVFRQHAFLPLRPPEERAEDGRDPLHQPDQRIPQRHEEKNDRRGIGRKTHGIHLPEGLRHGLTENQDERGQDGDGDPLSVAAQERNEKGRGKGGKGDVGGLVVNDDGHQKPPRVFEEPLNVACEGEPVFLHPVQVKRRQGKQCRLGARENAEEEKQDRQKDQL